MPFLSTHLGRALGAPRYKVARDSRNRTDDSPEAAHTSPYIVRMAVLPFHPKILSVLGLVVWLSFSAEPKRRAKDLCQENGHLGIVEQ